jgi:hypothetical protein
VNALSGQSKNLKICEIMLKLAGYRPNIDVFSAKKEDIKSNEIETVCIYR